MRLAIANITAGGLSGGYAKYLKRILPMIESSAKITALLVLVPRKFTESFESTSDKLRLIAHDRQSASLSKINKFQPDVVFIPTARCLEPQRRPEVVMVRNMEPLLVPFGGNSLSECVKNLARAFAARRACRKATKIIAVSNHVRSFLQIKWHVPEDRIGLVYHGIDMPDKELKPPKPEALEALRHPFLFTAGSIRPARGLEDLIQALPEIRCAIPNIQVVIAGKPDQSSLGWARHCEKLAERLAVADRIVWPGHFNDLELAWCFRNCEAFVTTTRAEACPNTALEAMSFGCQIVSTSQDPMPEFFRDSAVYYRPRDHAQLAERVCQIVRSSREDREARRGAAIQRAQSFSWTDTARKTVEELEDALEAFRPSNQTSARAASLLR